MLVEIIGDTGLSDESAKRYALPDRFFNDDIADRMWQKVLPSRHKLKEYAEALAKVVQIQGLRKDIKRLPSGQMLTAFLGGSFMRSMFYDRLNSNDPVARHLVIEEHLRRLLSKLPESFLRHPLKIDQELVAMIPLVSRGTLNFLGGYSDRHAYGNLDYDEKDIADFCLNIFLLNSVPDEFAIGFFDSCAWLRERQTRYYAHLKEAVEEKKPDAYEPMQVALSTWEYFSNRFSSLIENKKELSLRTVLEVDQMVSDLMDDPRFSPSAQARFAMKLEGSSLQMGMMKFIEMTQLDEAIAKRDEVLAITKIAQSLDAPIPDFVLDDFTRPVLQIFQQEFTNSLRAGGGTLEVFAEAMDRRERLRDTITGIISGSDTSRMTEIADLGVQLKAVTNELFEGIEASRASLEDCASIFLKALKTLEEHSPTQKTVVKSEPTSSGHHPSPELEAIQKQLNAAIAEAKQASSSEADTRLRYETLEAEVSDLKKALHNARASSAAQTSSAAESGLDISADWLRKVLKDELTPEEILKAYARLAADRLVVLPTAYKSARDAENFEMADRLAKLVDTLVYEYLDKIRSGVPDSEARELLGARYAANESDTVTNNARLRAMREFTYNGETVFFKQHVGIGGGYGTRNSIRIHFKVFDGKIVIAYCGQHLETMRTN